ncbi:MAG: hypothetical protein IJ787_05080 [Bacilli bacterium]|nr:hypothetical protein [Bacilli bacterium]
MKKSKVLIPAMALLLFSTAASITGTVAWFTSTRVYTMSAGDFAVVNTKDNLNATLAPGIGTILDPNNEKAIIVGESTLAGTFANDSARTTAEAELLEDDVGKIYRQEDSKKYYVCVGVGTLSEALDRPYSLTDASFDHNIAAQNLVVPDNEGSKIGSFVSMPTANINTAGIIRDPANSKAGVVLSAMTWDITFTVTFSDSASKDTGLFLDATALKSYVKLATDAAVTDTGYAFKIAIMPKTIPTGSLGLTKVWADNRPKTGDPHSQYIGGGAIDDALSTRTADYGAVTAQLINGTWTKDIASPALIDSADVSAVPTENTKTKAQALAMSNYLGYFKCNAGHDVSLTFTCVAFFEGSDPTIETAESTTYETVKAQMTFGVSNLTD